MQGRRKRRKVSKTREAHLLLYSMPTENLEGVWVLFARNMLGWRKVLEAKDPERVCTSLRNLNQDCYLNLGVHDCIKGNCIKVIMKGNSTGFFSCRP